MEDIKLKIFTVNGKEYKAKPFDFNMVCDLEDMGIRIQDTNNKPMATVRAYFAICTGKGKEYAGKEMEQHIINGGTFEDVVDIMNEEMDKSDFFRSLKKTEETEDAADQEEKK